MVTLRNCFLTLLGFVILSSTPIIALAQHGHKSPHGGTVQEADGIHAEFLIDKAGEPRLYLYDRSMTPLQRTDVEAKITLKRHGEADHTGALSFSKDPKDGPLYKGELVKGLKEWDSAVVSVKLKERWTEIRFSNHSKGKAGH